MLRKFLPAGHGPQRRDCLAGHVRFELRNVIANYPFEKSHRFAGIQPNFGHGDHSRLSCGAGDTQLGPAPASAVPSEFVHGLTTPACVCVTACMGAACAIAQWQIVVMGVVLVLVILVFGGPFEKAIDRRLPGRPGEVSD